MEKEINKRIKELDDTNNISDGYENADLHFIHGADDDGNQVMYIKTQ